MGTCQQGSGPPALSITLDAEELELLELVGPDVVHPIDSTLHQIDVEALAAGGDGTYTYAWTVTEDGDNKNTGSGVLQILSAGTTNGAQYDTLTVRSNATPGPPTDATYELTCTVTDGNSDTASVTVNLPIMALNLG